LRALGCDKPVIPGIMPVTSVASIKRMSELQGSDFPQWFADDLYAVEDQGPAAVRAVGVAAATKLCEELLAGGVPGLHFFAFNRATALAARDIHQSLGLRPA
jgi:methylenetetrahydrofolate reductase (NADPH)